MHLEEFAYGSSLIHKLDPRIKIAVFIIFSFLCLLTSSFNVLFFYNLFSIILLFLAKVSFRSLLKRFCLINFFNLLLWISLILGDIFTAFYEGEAIYFKQDTLHLALIITLKSNALFLGALGLISTTPLPALTHALIHLKVPSKLVIVFFLSYRYFSILHEEYDKLMLGVKAKGFNPQSNFNTYKTFAYLLAMLLLKSFRKAEDLYRGMLARGFKDTYPLLHHFRVQFVDYLFALFALAFLLTVYLCK